MNAPCLASVPKPVSCAAAAAAAKDPRASMPGSTAPKKPVAEIAIVDELAMVAAMATTAQAAAAAWVAVTGWVQAAERVAWTVPLSRAEAAASDEIAPARC